MRKPFTRGLMAGYLILFLTGCSTLPVPSVESGKDVHVEGLQRESTIDVASSGAPVGVVVEVPDLAAGSQEQFERASALLEVGQTERALLILEKLTQVQPELAGPWVNMGIAYLQLEEESAAIEAFNKALAANQHNCDALNQLGVLARKRGDFGEAEQYYQRCIEAQPSFADAHLNLAILYELYMGRLNEALVAYNEYQLSLLEPDATVSGWMIDLERRTSAVAQR